MTEVRLSANAYKAFVELHIEQGPLLEKAGRLTLIEHDPLAFLIYYGYSYDSAGQLTGYSYFNGPYESESGPNETATYSYDTRSQLTGADLTGTTNDRTYGYDSNGNRTADSFVSYQPGPYNRLQSDDNFTYTYDDEGNLIRKETAEGFYTVYTWDHRNRLTEVASYSDEDYLLSDVSYAYDAFNQLIGKDAETYIYDGGQIVLRFFGENLYDRYLWGPAVDQLLADEQIDNLFATVDDQTLWALTDRQGSVRDVVGNNSVLRKHVDFDAFGNQQGESWYNASGLLIEGTEPWASADAVDQLFYWTGRLFDKATGLQNNLNRWYDPFQGRFVSEDPSRFDAGDANLYRYVANNPVLHVDPSGLEEINPNTGQPLPGPSPLPPGFVRDPVTGQPVPGPGHPGARHPGRTRGIKNNPDGSEKEPGQQLEEIENAPDPPGWKKRTKRSEQDAQREWEEQAEEAARRHVEELNKKRATECAKAVGWGSFLAGIGIGIWEGGKWIAATAAAPETGGCSYAAAAALP